VYGICVWNMYRICIYLYGLCKEYAYVSGICMEYVYMYMGYVYGICMEYIYMNMYIGLFYGDTGPICSNTGGFGRKGGLFRASVVLFLWWYRLFLTEVQGSLAEVQGSFTQRFEPR